MDAKERNKLEKKKEEMYSRIGARIRALRKAKGFTTFESFAMEHNIDRSNYGKLERGRNMQISSLIEILALLGVSVEEFFSEGFSDL